MRLVLLLMSVIISATHIRAVSAGNSLAKTEARKAEDSEKTKDVFFQRPSSSDLSSPITLTLGDSNSEGAVSLADVVNHYRVEQGLPEIPVSAALTMVAEAHVADLERNRPRGRCNLHSWSTQGNWTSCCYTSDHAQAQCMWDKPSEVTDGLYQGNGYELAAWDSGGITSKSALSQWTGSLGHQNVILNRGTWNDNRWQAIGAAVSANYAVVWFGTEFDPTGSP